MHYPVERNINMAASATKSPSIMEKQKQKRNKANWYFLVGSPHGHTKEERKLIYSARRKRALMTFLVSDVIRGVCADTAGVYKCTVKVSFQQNEPDGARRSEGGTEQSSFYLRSLVDSLCSTSARDR